MNRRARSLVSLVSVAAFGAVAGLGSGPATAAPPSRETIVEQFSNTIRDYCDVKGLTAVDAGTFRSRLQLRTTRSGAEYFLEHINVQETVTGVASRRSVTIKTAYLAKDLKVTVDGGLTTVVTLLTGPSTAYGPDGRAIARDPGQFRFRVVISDNGTPNNPDDDYEVSFTVLKSSTGRTDDYCAAIVRVIG